MNFFRAIAIFGWADFKFYLKEIVAKIDYYAYLYVRAATLTFRLFQSVYRASNQIRVRAYIIDFGLDSDLKSRPV